LIEARLTDGSSEILMAIKSGRAIRFPEEKVRPTGRGAIGVGGIEVDDASDEVVGMICVNKQQIESGNVLVVSEKGFGKKTPIDEYRITNRGGKGVKTINITEKTGYLVGMLDVTDENDLMITCKSGVTIRTSVESIREAGRATQGVKLIRIDEDDSIAAITKLDKFEEEPEELATLPDAIILDDAAEAPETQDNDNGEIPPASDPENPENNS
jgi:DNA gyrase subunit A